jgi:RHH-type transcriptional regulator, rel operon repressor / antitoxin RelB
MTTIQISDDLASQIELGAQRAGETSDDFLREAVLSRLEDLEDIAIATERLKNPGRRIPLDEVARDLGLDD